MLDRTHAPLAPLGLILPVLVLAGCGSIRDDREPSVRSHGQGVVISGVALSDGSGTVLDALTGKVPSLKVQRYTNQCPTITLRNDATFRTLVSPHIFVDGIRATDTCILESLRSRDVQRVEVYPRGVSNRAEYPSHAHGLILVFMRS